MKRIAAAAIALGLMSGAQAAIVTYDFEATDPINPSNPNTFGFFSYDDTNTTTVSAPVGLSSEFNAITWYLGTAGGVDGSIPISTYVGIIKAGTDLGGGVFRP
jgi:hypothetical protein